MSLWSRSDLTSVVTVVTTSLQAKSYTVLFIEPGFILRQEYKDKSTYGGYFHFTKRVCIKV